jgi:hypothetical protein
MGTGSTFSFYFVGQILDTSPTSAGGVFSYAGNGETRDDSNIASVGYKRDGTADDTKIIINFSSSPDFAFTAGTNMRDGFVLSGSGAFNHYLNGSSTSSGSISGGPVFTSPGNLGVGASWINSGWTNQDYIYMLEVVASTSSWNSTQVAALDAYFSNIYGT